MTLFETIIYSFDDTNYLKTINKILEHKDVTHRQSVEFALFCASDLDQYYDVNKFYTTYEARKKCLDLITKWLLNARSVTKAEVIKTANNTKSVGLACPASYYALHAAANAVSIINYEDNAGYVVHDSYFAALYGSFNFSTVKNKKLKVMFWKLIEILNINSSLLKLLS